MGEDYLGAEAGFTLAEVLVALVLLSLLTVTLYAVFSTTQLWLGQASGKMKATDHALAIMEHLRAASIRLNSLPVAASDSYCFTDDDTRNRTMELTELGISIPDPLGLEEQVIITRRTEADALFQVEVTVFWQEGGRRRSIIASSLLSAR